ncbi:MULTISPECIES: outer membrane protein [unclassified Rhizobium]|uniref:outer membrane protein n=1 Tax=unclassified Rhizobium TaxID=2613769 RepID=UPI0016011F30|nr:MULTISPECIES: outer membrane protein [unclassified Rhizobium]MBB1248092.1 porin family protein [Rhizobium sp. G21]MCV3765403.1 porin family protein [Rhizobium sp. TRM95796]
MRNLFVTLAASTMMLSALTAAQAADAIDEVPIAPEAQDAMAPVGGWDGAYVGGRVTQQWAKTAPGGYDTNGLGGGLYGGYNMQQGQIVYGGEADVNYSGVDGNKNGVETTQRLNGAIRGRVGYDLQPALVYGAAGLAATNVKAEDGTSEDSKTLFGATIGAGVEAKITDQITARTEYRFTNYQTQTFDLDSGARDRGFKEHQVSVGLGMRF